MNERWLLIKHNKTFITWFNESVSKDSSASKIIKCLSCMPTFNIITWSAYNITKFSFYIKSKDDHNTMQNNGVMVGVESMYFSSSKYNNHVLVSIAYFGVTEDILEIDYVAFKVSLFKCNWIDINIGVETDELGFTWVDI